MTDTGGAGAAVRRLGRYHLGDPLGGGPTGEVFRAKVYGVAGFERQFAVKRFHPQLVLKPEAAAKVAAAARMYGGLEHPRIARLHEYGVTGGHTFTATELVKGLDVARLIAATYGLGEPMVAGAVVSLVTQIARAVGYAHGRGIPHLGICPTNLICTPEGEVKVTDFGLLPTRLPARPADDDSLGARIPYLAPEQIANEQTSSATDVFQIGVVAFELFDGKPCFTAPTPFEVAQEIMSARPRALNLPKLLGKVLIRCLARSPYERFPDAGALADALEASTRATPLPGGRRDIGGAVRAAMERLAAMHDQQVSGALSFPLPAPPRPTAPDGVTPPPVLPSNTPLSRMLEEGATPAPELLGAGELRTGDMEVPTIPRRTVMGVGVPNISRESDADEDAETQVRDRGNGMVRSSGEAAGRHPLSDPLTPPPVPVAGQAAPPPSPEGDIGAEVVSRLDELSGQVGHGPVSDAIPQPEDMPGHSDSFPEIELSGAEPVTDDADDGQLRDVPVPPPFPVAQIPLQPSGAVLGADPEPAVKRKGARAPLLITLGVVLAAAGGYLVYDRFFAGDEPAGKGPVARGKPSAAKAIDAGAKVAVVAGDADAAAGTTAPATTIDAAPVAAAPADAAPVAVAPPDAAPVAAAPPDAAPVDVAAGQLVIRSTPEGAKIYLDGTLKGKTPLTLEGVSDRQSLALIKPGYKLHTGETTGLGLVNVTLEEVTPPGGPGGIKVRCKQKNRYYVFVDGRDVGQLCPTERIGVDKGEHVVEIYDPLTEQRRSFRARVKQTRNSVRVRVD